MKTLERGAKAPPVELPLIGGGRFSLSQSLVQGRVLLAFFKISCPVCQYTFPFLERLAKRAKGKGLNVVGVSQDDPKSTDIFCKTYGITFPIALDDTDKYPASNAYGLASVPSMFVIAENGEIEETIIGWSKAEINAIDNDYSGGQNASAQLFLANEDVVEFRAG